MTEKQIEYGEPVEDESLPAVRTNQDLLAYALDKGAGVEVLEKLMALQERHEANEARKAYHKAMAAFKADPPQISKNRHVKFTTSKGTTEYDHASLDHAADEIGKAMAKHGLSASWKTDHNGTITVKCIITHELGHSESTSLSAPADTSGSKNPIQSLGSTISYLQRYTLLAITGLAAKGQDDDGAGASGGADTLNEEEVANIEALITEVKANRKKLLEYFGVGGVELLPASRYKEAVAMLERKRNA